MKSLDPKLKKYVFKMLKRSDVRCDAHAFLVTLILSTVNMGYFTENLHKNTRCNVVERNTLTR